MKYDVEAYRKSLGVKLKRMRLERSWVPRRMVHDWGLNPTQIEKAEHGQAVPMETLFKYCEAFDMTIEELLAGIA